MPIAHMVWIKFKPGISAARQQHHLDALASLRGKIPGVSELQVGENFTDRANGFTHGLLVTLDSREALAAYGPHPAHAAVAGPLKDEAEFMAMDFEYESRGQ